MNALIKSMEQRGQGHVEIIRKQAKIATKPTEVAPIGSGGGNTKTPPSKKSPKKKRVAASKKWCITLNNPTTEQLEWLRGSEFREYCDILVWQEEVGEGGEEEDNEGTHHVQGAMVFKKKCRPIETFPILFRTSWHKMKAKGDEAFEYASKVRTRVKHGVLHGWEPVPVVETIEELYPWQDEIETMCLKKADDRTIVWLHEPYGRVGKSAFVKYMCVKHKALCLSGKTADIYNGIKMTKELTGRYPKIILVDVPRENLGVINYGAIEKVKDGCFFSGKYEGGMCVMNCPHVIFFANEEPRVEAFSADRWDVRQIVDKHLVKAPVAGDI